MKLKSFKTLVRQVINENRESREASANNRRKLTRKYSRYSGMRSTFKMTILDFSLEDCNM